MPPAELLCPVLLLMCSFSYRRLRGPAPVTPALEVEPEQELKRIHTEDRKMLSASQLGGANRVLVRWNATWKGFSEAVRNMEQREGASICNAQGDINVYLLSRHLTRLLTMDPENVYQTEFHELETSARVRNPLFNEVRRSLSRRYAGLTRYRWSTESCRWR